MYYLSTLAHATAALSPESKNQRNGNTQTLSPIFSFRESGCKTSALQLDCVQSLFSSKICGKERKTSMHVKVTVSVTWERHRCSHVMLTVTLPCLLALRSFPRIFEEKRDCSQSTLQCSNSICLWIKNSVDTQGPKLTFLGRHQLATEIIFQSPYAKMWLPKGVSKIFPSHWNTNTCRWKTLVANFSFKNQNEENVFGAAMMIFLLMNKIKLKYKHWLFIHRYIYHWKTKSNESNAGHISSFMQLPNVSSQLYTCSCARLKNCHLAFCSMFKMTIDGSHQATTVQHFSFQSPELHGS